MIIKQKAKSTLSYLVFGLFVLFTIILVLKFHLKSRDVREALDRPLPVIKEVDPGAISIKTKAATEVQNTPSDSSRDTNP